MFFIGIDLADKSFDFCIVNLYGDVVSRGREEMRGSSPSSELLTEKGLMHQAASSHLKTPGAGLLSFSA